MTKPRSSLMFLTALTGVMLAGAVPVGLSIHELSSLRASIAIINEAGGAARQARDVGQKIELALTDFMASALELDESERQETLKETDTHVRGFKLAVSMLTQANAHSPIAGESKALAEATDAIFHSWNEIRDQKETKFSSAEKTFHFLTISDNSKKARTVLNGIETRAVSVAEAQSTLAFQNIKKTGALLIVAIVFGIIVNGAGTLRILVNSEKTRKSNEELDKTNLELRSVQKTLETRSQRLSEAQRLGKLGEWSYSFATNTFQWAPETYELLGYDEASFRWSRDKVVPVRDAEDGRRLTEAQAKVIRTGGIETADIWAIKGDGSIGYFAVTTKAEIGSGRQMQGFTGTIQDISERKISEEQLEKLAYYDQLTGLPNRSLFWRRMSDILAQSAGLKREGAVLVLDLDRFKEVNDSLGHAAGDELLRNVAHQVSTAIDGDCFLARLGGDEFAIIMPDCSEQAAMEHLANTIIAKLTRPIRLLGGEVLIGTSIGVAKFPRDGANSNELLRNADLALYHAKENGRGQIAVFEAGMSEIAQYKIALARDLRDAIGQNEGLYIEFQPKVVLDGGSVQGFEALMRWKHPVFGVVPPSDFIPVAESSGVICELGMWILRESVRQGQAWLAAGEPPREIAVNVSAAQIWQSDFVTDVAAALAETGFPPHLLCLELTESLFADHGEGRVRTALEALKKLGVTLALDDFGTNYSSLGYLKQLPFDQLKIDRVFVAGVDLSTRARELLKGIIALGKGLGMAIVGEGAETAEEVQTLRELGCNFVQGYAMSRPCSAAQALVFAQTMATGAGVAASQIEARNAATLPAEIARLSSFR